MAQQTTPGGSNATDFQPTTGNPQDNVSGGLQPNYATLQPVTTSSDSNAFNQPGINPQAFPQTNSLRVLSTSTQTLSPSVSGEQADTSTKSPNEGTFTLFFVVAAVLIVILLVIAKTAKPAGKSEEKKSDMPQAVTKITKSNYNKKSSASRRIKKEDY